MDILHYYDLQRWKFLSPVRKKIPFLHKFLAALEIQSHASLLLSIKYAERQAFSASVLRHYESEGLWYFEFYTTFRSFNCIACVIFSFLYIVILHLLQIKLYKCVYTYITRQAIGLHYTQHQEEWPQLPTRSVANFSHQYESGGFVCLSHARYKLK